MVQNTIDKKANKIQACELMEISESNIFDIIEIEDIECIRKKLLVSPESINCINEYDFTPLDLALMLNNKEIIVLLLKNGAIENPTMPDWNDRYERVCVRLGELDVSLRQFLKNFDVSALNHDKIEEYDSMLKNLDSKMRLARRMKTFFETTPYPGEARQSNGAQVHHSNL
ncbi:ankyrin repeat and fibronectin type-III domain-containing 1 [Brachionus plicatilis]|uniref:Ankyrin repeat and fibronectin type-III domain-containing 1 n=1 Tax=Brachionus plicatilis TaxID=10195 RepID=A0A3M7SVC4_BRAPC|nr:ankyrin repeat and fibronectin type-III domain-containing 1 [Brachionus plicatilis]